MRYCLSILSVILICLGVMWGSIPCNTAEAADTSWYWISSDAKYTKYYDQSQVLVTNKVKGVATQIRAVTRTVYSYAGAKETLENYGIKDILPNQLSYSIANVEIIPQTRSLAYVLESFYDNSGHLLWSKRYQPLKYKEMNFQEFDEDFYASIVDAVFDKGEMKRRSAADRWLTLWQTNLSGGGTVISMADTTTMRLSGENLIFWEWQEYKDAKGNVSEIRFLKKAVNIPQYTEKTIRYKHWDSTGGWQDYTADNTDGNFHAVEKASTEERALLRLKVYRDANMKWVSRYSTGQEEDLTE